VSDSPPAPGVADLEEPLRDLLHLCEGLRVLCALGEDRGLTLADAGPLGTLAAQVAAELRQRFAHAVPRPLGDPAE
jgi:hypothetical protein